MSPLLHFFDMQNVFLRFRGVPGKIICFNSWFRLKIIVVGRYTTRPDCRFNLLIHLHIFWIFPKFEKNHLCQSLFFNKVAGLRSQIYFLIDFPQIFSFFLQFLLGFFVYLLCFAFFFLLVCFLKLKIYILMHSRLCERVSNKIFSLGRFPGTRLLFLT